MYQNVKHNFNDGFTGRSNAWKAGLIIPEGGYTYKKFIKKYGPVNSSRRCIITAVHKNGYDVKFECDDCPFVKCYMSKIEALVEWKVGEIINLKIIDILTDNNVTKRKVKNVFLSLKQNHKRCLTGKMKRMIEERRRK